MNLEDQNVMTTTYWWLIHLLLILKNLQLLTKPFTACRKKLERCGGFRNVFISLKWNKKSKVISCKWIYKIEDLLIDAKLKLLLKGSLSVRETSTNKLITNRNGNCSLILSIAANERMHLTQLDVCCIFIWHTSCSYIHETIRMLIMTPIKSRRENWSEKSQRRESREELMTLIKSVDNNAGEWAINDKSFIIFFF